MAVTAEERSSDRIWLGAKVDQGLFAHIEDLALRLGTTRSHVVRTVLRHTDVDRLLNDLRLEASTDPTAAHGPGAAA